MGGESLEASRSVCSMAEKRRRQDERRGPRDVTLLPPAIVQSVLGFVLREEQLPRSSRDLSKPFVNVASVSRGWYAALDEVASISALRTVSLAIDEPTRSQIVEVRRRLTMRRGWITRIKMFSGAAMGVGEWAALFSHVPSLEALVMMECVEPLVPSSGIGEMVQALALQCPRLKALTLPNVATPSSTEANHLDAYVGTLQWAMQVWSQHGGLQQLCVAMRGAAENQRGRVPSALLSSIARFCPEIRVLDGYKSAVQCFDSLFSGEQWFVDLASWQRFCSACTQLREFDWVCVPFATRFFELFGSSLKPRLTRLLFAAPTNWSWTQYFDHVPESTKLEMEKAGFGPSAKLAQAAVKACPNLETLQVDLGYAVGDVACMNPEIFGDDFVETVAKECKKVRGVFIVTGRAGPLRRRHALASVTDRALRALATLPTLFVVRLLATNITGSGLFELVVNHQAKSRRRHDYDIFCNETTSFSHEIRDDSGFYGALYGFMARLAESTDELEIESRYVWLRFVNNTASPVEASWSAVYFEKLHLQVEKARANHPRLQLRVLVQEYDDEMGYFKSILEFALVTEPTRYDVWFNEDEDKAQDTPIDDVFVNRVYDRGEHRDASEDEARHDDSEDEDQMSDTGEGRDHE